jgi:hypothetical protein
LNQKSSRAPSLFCGGPGEPLAGPREAQGCQLERRCGAQSGHFGLAGPLLDYVRPQFNDIQANGGNRGYQQLSPVKMISVVSNTQGTWWLIFFVTDTFFDFLTYFWALAPTGTFTLN